MCTGNTKFQHTVDETRIEIIARTNGTYRRRLACGIAFSQSAVGP